MVQSSQGTEQYLRKKGPRWLPR